MKARFPIVCECCKANIATGAQVVMFHGRPWIPSHVSTYRQNRRITAKR
jgi:hypothetical protein